MPPHNDEQHDGSGFKIDHFRPLGCFVQLDGGSTEPCKRSRTAPAYEQLEAKAKAQQRPEESSSPMREVHDISNPGR